MTVSYNPHHMKDVMGGAGDEAQNFLFRIPDADQSEPIGDPYMRNLLEIGRMTTELGHTVTNGMYPFSRSLSTKGLDRYNPNFYRSEVNFTRHQIPRSHISLQLYGPTPEDYASSLFPTSRAEVTYYTDGLISVSANKLLVPEAYDLEAPDLNAVSNENWQEWTARRANWEEDEIDVTAPPEAFGPNTIAFLNKLTGDALQVFRGQLLTNGQEFMTPFDAESSKIKIPPFLNWQNGRVVDQILYYCTPGLSSDERYKLKRNGQASFVFDEGSAEYTPLKGFVVEMLRNLPIDFVVGNPDQSRTAVSLMTDIVEGQAGWDHVQQLPEDIFSNRPDMKKTRREAVVYDVRRRTEEPEVVVQRYIAHTGDRNDPEGKEVSLYEDGAISVKPGLVSVLCTNKKIHDEKYGPISGHVKRKFGL